MKPTSIKQINRRTSLQAIGLVLFANLILALIYYKTLFVWQARINMSQIDSLSLESESQVCQTGALQDYADSSVYPPCENHHKLKVSF